jgi:hypothetical protein
MVLFPVKFFAYLNFEVLVVKHYNEVYQYDVVESIQENDDKQNHHHQQKLLQQLLILFVYMIDQIWLNIDEIVLELHDHDYV